jgi:phage shock protein A
MSDRSELINRVLHTWDFSEEGHKYLAWLLQPEAEKLDGGAVLREAVLDEMEDDQQLIELRRQRQKVGLHEVLSALPRKKRSGIRKATDGINASIRQQTESLRLQAHALREIRHTLNWDRLEALKSVSDLIDSQPADELTSFLKRHEIAREVAAAVAALRRTRAEKVDIEARWKVHSSENPWTEMVQSIAENAGESSFDDYREKLDRYYAQEAVKKLDGMIDRAAALTPVNLEIKDSIVTQLFQEAHDVFLHGFDAAAIALCRSLVEHALKDKLSAGAREGLAELIKLADKSNLLGGQSIRDAGNVQKAGNKIMHDVGNLQHTAQLVLDSTRGILTELYGIAATL